MENRTHLINNIYNELLLRGRVSSQAEYSFLFGRNRNYVSDSKGKVSADALFALTKSLWTSGDNDLARLVLRELYAPILEGRADSSR